MRTQDRASAGAVVSLG